MKNKFNFSSIKKLRKHKKISLKVMSEKCHLSLPSLIDIENNRANPTLKTMNSISEVLAIPLSTMIHLVELYKPVINKFKIYKKDPGMEIYFYEANLYKFVIAKWKKGLYCSDPDFHVKDFNESFVILQGKIEIKINDKDYILSENEIIQFPAKYEHEYKVLEDTIACGFFCKESPLHEGY